MKLDKKEHPALQSAAVMCDLLRDAMATEIQGSWRGDSHGYHPCGILKDGILFQNDWNTNKYCSIKLADDPKKDWIPADHGASASRCYSSNATPRPKEGNLTTVWSNGGWKTKGNWCNRINNILYQAEEDIQTATRQQQLANKERSKSIKTQEKKDIKNLNRAYL